MTTIFEQVNPETAERIIALAKEKGLSVDEYLRSILPSSTEAQVLSAEERTRTWREWITERSLNGVIADDNRGNIYTREDDAL